MKRIILAMVFFLGAGTIGGSLAASPGPGPPRWVAVRYLPQGQRVGMQWTPVAGATSYRLLRRTAEENGYAAIAAIADNQHFDLDTAGGVTYYYVVQALAGEREGPLSREKSVSVPAGPPDTIPPPGWRSHLVEVVEEEGSPPRFRVRLVWRKVPGAAGYRLYRSSVAGGEYEPVTSTEGTLTYDDDVASDTQYYYVVTSIDGRLRESLLSLERVVRVEPDTIRAAGLKKEESLQLVSKLWRVYNESPENISVGRRAKLANPFDVVCDGKRGLVYVSSTRYRHVAVFNAADGTLAGYIGPQLGKEELKQPLGLSLDSKGRLYIVDQEEAAVFVVSAKGKLKRRVEVPARDGGEKPRLVDVAVLADGRFFVTDNANGQVVGFSSRGKEIGRWGGKGRRDDQLMGATSIEATTDEMLAVADGQAGKVKLFSPRGRLESVFGGRSPGADQHLFLSGFTVLGDGRFLVLDLAGPVISEYRSGASGERHRSILAVDGRREGLEVLGPTGIAGDGEGRIFVVDGIANRLAAFLFVDGPGAEGSP